MKTLFTRLLLTLYLILLCSCASRSQNDPLQNSSYMNIINTYSGEYFVGVGTGEGPTEEIAIKIAKTRALGELADNVKVAILSQFEIITTERASGSSYQLDETVKERIISIGNATVRSPDYEILNVSHTDNKFNAEVLVKKLKSQHIEEAAMYLEFFDDVDKLVELLK